MKIPGILLIDKIGRRNILIIGAIGMLICEYIIAIVGTIVGQSNEAAQKTLIAFVCELYPISIRAKCMSLSSASNWLFNFALGYATPYMVDQDEANLGSKVFFVWGSTYVGCLIFAICCIWETKGLSLEQVNYLVRNSSPIKSAKLNKQLQTGNLMENEKTVTGGPTNISKTSIVSVELPNISTDMKDRNENISSPSIVVERL